MDGFAIRAADVASATEDAPVRLTVVGESRAGGAPDARVMPETAIRIATGAPLPQGADAVVPVEDTTPLDEQGGAGPRGRQVLGPVPAATLVHARVKPGNAIRIARQRRPGRRRHRPARRPRDARRRGARVRGRRRHGRRASPPDRRGPRHRRRGARPRHGPGTGRDPRRATVPGLRALVRDAGAVPLDLGIAVDTLEDVEARLRRGLAEADLVVVSGGVSVGPYDVVRLAFDNVGHMNLWRVAVQPGKPFAFGRADVDGRDDPGAAVRPAGQPGVGVRHLRAVRAARPPAARRPGAPPPARSTVRCSSSR